MTLITLLRGGGDLASGVALRLHRAGVRVVITELSQPLMVRRLVSFGEAIYSVSMTIEGITAQLSKDLPDALFLLSQGKIPVLADPEAEILHALRAIKQDGSPIVLVDGRMTKQAPEYDRHVADLVIGLGPGFIAGENCHAVVETSRGHWLGRVIWHGAPEVDTGIPDRVADHGEERVLRAPKGGILLAHTDIGSHLEPGQLVAEVGGLSIRAPFRGVLRGLIRSGLQVQRGLKVGDLDPRDDSRYCYQVSDKALAIGGGVLEAILSQVELRPYLWD